MTETFSYNPAKVDKLINKLRASVFKKLEKCGPVTEQELRKSLSSVLKEFYNKVPVEFDTYDLFALARRSGWLHETEDGLFELLNK
jgi:hypothetical protein